MADAQRPRPGHELVDPALADRHLGQRAAEHHRDAVRRVALELGLQVLRGQRGAPAELDDVDELAGDLDQAVDLGDRQAAVEDVGDALLARLGAAGREPDGHGRRAPYWALSMPIVTTTLTLSPAMARVLGSSGTTSPAEMPTIRATRLAASSNPSS